MKLLGIISVGFDVTDQLLVRFSPIISYGGGGGKDYNDRVHQIIIDVNKEYDSVRKGVLYNILIEFGVPMKLVRLIKIC
jgi:hypothetical protein